MFLRMFFDIFPEIARQETRSLVAFADPVLPADDYALMEFYCEDPRCNCRNVILKVLTEKLGWVATVNHAFDVDGFRDVDLPQTFLDPTGPQSHLSERLLVLTREILSEPLYAQRLERHYHLVKNRHLSSSPQGQSSTKLKRKLLRKAGRC